MNPFVIEAPKHWAASLPVIPIYAGQKRPAISRWQIYADRMPTEEEQRAWLAQYANCNIGLPMGQASGLIAIDIDTNDERVLAVLDQVLPKSPWRRVGAKGAVYVYRYEGQQTFKIKADDGIIRGERTLLSALGEMKVWVETYPEKVAGDDLDPEKAQQKVIEFLFKDVTGEKRRTLPEGWDEGLTAEDKKQMGLEFGDDVERWGIERIIQHLRAEFQCNQDPQSQAWTNAVKLALDRMGRNPELNPIDEDRVLKFITSQSRGNLTLGALRKQLRTLKQGEKQGNDHTEIAKAVRTDLEPFGEVRFDMGQFWQWKGACWEPLEEQVIRKHIQDEYSKMPAAKRSSDHKGIVHTMRDQCAIPLMSTPITGVNFANGFLTEDLELLDHNPDFGTTYVLPYRYVPEDTECPMFMRYLHDSWGHDPDFQDKMAALQEAMAATMMGIAPRYQQAICLFGQAGSGKSRIPEILKGLMPSGCFSAVPPTEWADKFMPAQMAGKLINFAGEISENKYIAGDRFKEIVEGATITAQHKGQQLFRFQPTAAQWFCSNHLPKTKDTSEGFNRRWLFLEWNKKVNDDEKIIDLDQLILANEREQIASWALEGLRRLRQQKSYTLPASHIVLTGQMAEENNSVRYFLSRCPRLVIGVDRNASTAGLEIYNVYWQFCLATAARTRAGPTSFHAMMKELSGIFGFKQEEIMSGKTGKMEFHYRNIKVVNLMS
jgi:putative DNA primase/helicase